MTNTTPGAELSDDRLTLGDVAGVIAEVAEQFDGGEYAVTDEMRRVLIDFAHGLPNERLFMAVVGHYFLQNPIIPARELPAASLGEPWFKVGRFFSSAERNQKVLVLAVGSQIEEYERHHSFIEWVATFPSPSTTGSGDSLVTRSAAPHAANNAPSPSVQLCATPSDQFGAGNDMVDRIVLWSRGVEPNYWFIAERSKRPNINGMPVYETLDPITGAAKAEGDGGEART